jgi:tRNA(fMet)-specific endonuclease VapC
VMQILDTTAFSAVMRHEPAMMDFLRAHSPGEVAVAPPVVAEIEYGIQRLAEGSRKRSLLEEEKEILLGAIRLLEWTPDASVRFGGIKASLERAGTLVDDFDIAVAAIALSHGAGVLTANLAHFSRVEGLACSSWTLGSGQP